MKLQGIEYLFLLLDIDTTQKREDNFKFSKLLLFSVPNHSDISIPFKLLLGQNFLILFKILKRQTSRRAQMQDFASNRLF